MIQAPYKPSRNEILNNSKVPIFCPIKVATRNITTKCFVNAFNGYGQLALATVQELQRQDLRVSVLPIDKSELYLSIPDTIKSLIVTRSSDDYELIIAPPNHIASQNRKSLHFTMWEAGFINRDYINTINKNLVLIVPCDWNAIIFDAGGVSIPIRKVNLGINADIFKLHRFTNKDGIVFGAGGRIAHGGIRKGIEEVIFSFIKAFPVEKDVELRIKVWPDCKVSNYKDSRIKLYRSPMKENELADWYSDLDVFISMSTSEGFGLMPLQAMGCGRPVIACIAHGHAEYLDKSISFPLEYDLVRSDEVAPNNGFYKGLWFQPKQDSAVDCMRFCYNNYSEVVKRGYMSAEVAKKFSWQVYGERLANVLEEFGVVAR